MSFINKFKQSVSNQTSLNSKIGYALSEIILLVIGILIAVSINNWNEQRTRNNELNNILKIIKSDLEDDVEASIRIQNIYSGYKTYVEAVLSKQVDRDYYNKNPKMAFVIRGFPELYLHRRGYGLLQAYIDSEELSNDSLVGQIAAFYTTSTQSVRADDKLRGQDQQDNFINWKNNQPWWPEYIYSQKIDGFIEYAIDDPDYINRVASFYLIHYKAFLPELTKYKKDAEALIEMIKAKEKRDNAI